METEEERSLVLLYFAPWLTLASLELEHTLKFTQKLPGLSFLLQEGFTSTEAVLEVIGS